MPAPCLGKAVFLPCCACFHEQCCTERMLAELFPPRLLEGGDRDAYERLLALVTAARPAPVHCALKAKSFIGLLELR